MTVTLVLPLPTPGEIMQWEYVVCNFKPDRLIVVGQESVMPKSNSFRTAEFVRDFRSIPDDAGEVIVLAAAHGRYIVGLESLEDLTHPDDVCYVFGGNHQVLTVDKVDPAWRTVYVPTDTTDDMWSWIAYAAVAWDRRMKAHG
jgi:hypothetical protein